MYSIFHRKRFLKSPTFVMLLVLAASGSLHNHSWLLNLLYGALVAAIGLLFSRLLGKIAINITKESILPLFMIITIVLVSLLYNALQLSSLSTSYFYLILALIVTLIIAYFEAFTYNALLTAKISDFFGLFAVIFGLNTISCLLRLALSFNLGLNFIIEDSPVTFFWLTPIGGLVTITAMLALLQFIFKREAL
jgi:hypothetical protein